LDLEVGNQTYDNMNISLKEQTVGRFIERTAKISNTRLNLNANKVLFLNSCLYKDGRITEYSRRGNSGNTL
jgi:hypothetical protein